MKKGLMFTGLVLFMSFILISFVSAEFFSDFWEKITEKEKITGNVVSEGYVDGCPYFSDRFLFGIDELNDNKFNLIPKEVDNIKQGEFFILWNSNVLGLFKLSSIYKGSTFTQDRVRFKDFLTGENYDTTMISEGIGNVYYNGVAFNVLYSGDKTASSDTYFASFEFPSDNQKISFENCLNPQVTLNFDTMDVLYAAKFTANPVDVEQNSWIVTNIAGGIDKPIDVTYGIINFSRNGETLVIDEFIKISNPVDDSISERFLRHIGSVTSTPPTLEKDTSFWSGKRIESNQIIRDYSIPMKGVTLKRFFNIGQTTSISSITLNGEYSSGSSSETEIKTMIGTNTYNADINSLVQVGDLNSVGYYNI